MAETKKQTEAMPVSYPYIPPYAHIKTLAGQDHILPSEVVWQRIESWIPYRWGEREIVWIVEGEGAWTPPLSPVVTMSVEVWENGSWTATTAPATPYGGLDFPGDGPYRITASVGSSDDVPEIVQEAWQRLHEYLRGVAFNWRTETANTEGVAYAFAAKAIQLSGAADLLRPYRRIK